MGHRVASPLVESPPLFRYGLPELFYGTLPAAGADFVLPVDGQYWARPLAVFVRLVTSAAVANREVVVDYLDQQAQRWMLNGSAVVQAASLTVDYVFDVFRDVVTQPVDGTQLIPLSEHLLESGMQLRIHVVNIDVADQLSRIRIRRERFYSTNEPPTSYPVTHAQ